LKEVTCYTVPGSFGFWDVTLTIGFGRIGIVDNKGFAFRYTCIDQRLLLIAGVQSVKVYVNEIIGQVALEESRLAAGRDPNEDNGGRRIIHYLHHH